MIRIIDASLKDYEIISKLAEKTWSQTYRDILSQEQIEYMLEMMYSRESFNNQIENLSHHFVLIMDDTTSDDFLGFISYEHSYNDELRTKIHKLYVLPQFQGLGLGRFLINEAIARAKKNLNVSVILNMNKHNKSISFYQQMGFEIIGEEDIDIGSGYLMEDLIFEKKI